jgi:hypothetical protein
MVEIAELPNIPKIVEGKIFKRVGGIQRVEELEMYLVRPQR